MTINKGRIQGSALTGNRKSIRLQGYDYSEPGYYFVTMLVQDRLKLFWDENLINDAGKMIEKTILEIPIYYDGIGVDEFVIMPDHIHVILTIISGRIWESAPTKNIFKLSDIIQRFKILTTNKYIYGVRNNHWLPFDGRLWQRDYYERIIRDELELNRIREYLLKNPLRLLKGGNPRGGQAGLRPYENPLGRIPISALNKK